MNIFNDYKGLPRSMYALFCVQIINRLGDFVFPFLSLLLTEKMNFSYGMTGVIVMTASLITIPASLLGGKFADQVSRRKTYLIGQTLAALSILICGVIDNSLIIVGLLIISAFFNGFVRPTISAIMADVLLPEKRDIGSSLLYLGINIGVALGPIIAGFLFNNYISLLFILDALTSFIAIFIFYTYIEETKPEIRNIKEKNSKEKVEVGNLFQVLLKRPKLLIFFIINIFYSFAYCQISFSLPLMMNNVFAANGPKNYGYLISINAVTVIFLTFVIIGITKRFGNLVNIIIAGFFYMIGLGMIGKIGDNFILFIISTILWSIGEILVVTNNGVYVANNSPKNFRARISSVNNLTYGVAMALGTSVVGKYIDHHGIYEVWSLIFVVVCIGTCFMTVLHFYSLKSDESDECVKNEILERESI